MTGIELIKFYVGDVDPDNQWLADNIYTFLLTDANGSEIDAAIEALDSIISQIALSPESWVVGDAEEERPPVEVLVKRLESLKAKRSQKRNKVMPMILHSDREDWDDINCIYDTGTRRSKHKHGL